MPRRVRRPDEGEPEAHSPRRTATHFTVGERKVCWIRREGRKVRGARCRRSCATLPSAWYLNSLLRCVAVPVCELAPLTQIKLAEDVAHMPRRRVRRYIERFRELLSDRPCAMSITTSRSHLERLSPFPAVAVVTRILAVYGARVRPRTLTQAACLYSRAGVLATRLTVSEEGDSMTAVRTYKEVGSVFPPHRTTTTRSPSAGW